MVIKNIQQMCVHTHESEKSSEFLRIDFKVD